MTNDQAIRAGALALQRKDIRQAVTENRLATLTLTINGKHSIHALDAVSTRAVLDALDQSLSDRLGKLGVAEV